MTDRHPGTAGTVGVLPSAVRDVLRLVVPLSCGGCGAPDTAVCPACAARLHDGPLRVEASAPRLDPVDGTTPWPVWAATSYTGPVRDLVVGWKDHGRADLTRALAAAVCDVARQVAGEVLATVPPGGVLWVVPVPSSAAARRRRGRGPVHALARAVHAELARHADRSGVDVHLVRCLRHRSRTWVRAGDQVGLGSRARGGNVAGTLRPRRPSRARRSDQRVTCLLVDDVLTTGATMAECARTLSAAGRTLVAGIALAATPGPSSYPPGATNRHTARSNRDSL